MLLEAARGRAASSASQPGSASARRGPVPERTPGGPRNLVFARVETGQNRPRGGAMAGPEQATTSGLGQAPPAGPESILTCSSCGKRNKIRPSAKGAPHCGNCGKPLPWVVNASDATFEVEARASPAVL